MEQTLNQILQQLSQLKSDLKTSLDDLKTSLDEHKKQTKQEFDQNKKELKSLSDTIGTLFETQARELIAHKYGFSFSDRFLVESIYGMVRLSYPKKDSLMLPSEFQILDETQIQDKYVRCLRDYIFQHRLYESCEQKLFAAIDIIFPPNQQIKALFDEIKKLETLDGKDDKTHSSILQDIKNLLAKEISLLEKKKKKAKTCVEALGKLAEFYSVPKHERVAFMTSNSRAGVMFFTSQFLKKNDPPILSLEFDCRGSVQCFDDNPTIQVGEIKSKIEGNHDKAVSQLLIRLKTLKIAHELIAKQIYKKSNISVKAIGIIFHGSKNYSNQSKVYDSILIVDELVA